MSVNENKKQAINKASDDDIINCAKEQVLTIPGVLRLSGVLSESLNMNFLGMDKGVRMSRGDEGLSFEIYIVVKYLEKIPQLAWEIQGKVKEAIEELTGEKVLEVNIHVQGVDLAGEEIENDKN